MRRIHFINILLAVVMLLSCTGHRHNDGAVTMTDSLSVRVYDSRYRSVALTDSLVAALDTLSFVESELRMVTCNAKAYSAELNRRKIK